MRVHDSNLNAITVGPRQASRADTVQTGRSEAHDGAGHSGQDRVSLSDLSSALGRLTADDPGRAERVSELRAVYRAGTYRVNAAAASSKLVDDSMKVS